MAAKSRRCRQRKKTLNTGPIPLSSSSTPPTTRSRKITASTSGREVLQHVKATNMSFRDMALSWRTWEEWMNNNKIDFSDISAISIYDYLVNRIARSKRNVTGARVTLWSRHIRVSGTNRYLTATQLLDLVWETRPGQFHALSTPINGDVEQTTLRTSGQRRTGIDP